jgi:hypothetical protein
MRQYATSVIVRFSGLVALLALVVAGCGGTAEEKVAQPQAPPTLLAEALPELEVRARSLDASQLAADSFDPNGLGNLLANAGYLGGSEREFYGRSETFDHVVARTLRFADVDGAEAYLRWLGANAGDFLGKATPQAPLAVGSSPLLFSLERCDVCKKQQPAFLAGWRRGPNVAFLLGQGPGVSRDQFETLSRALDERIGG